MMKAVVLVDKTNMKIQDVAKPSPKTGEVLIRVVYTALDTAFHEVANRTMVAGSFLHNLKVNPLVAGWHFSGTVESVAEGVGDLKVGDAVYGHLQYCSSTKQGALADFITVPASECAKIPEGIELDVAAAVATEALTALTSRNKRQRWVVHREEYSDNCGRRRRRYSSRPNCKIAEGRNSACSMFHQRCIECYEARSGPCY